MSRLTRVVVCFLRSSAKWASATAFSHSDFRSFLVRHHRGGGRLDYAEAAQDPRDLDRYLARLRTTSPDSHSDAFPSEAHRLAYWINAYNAWAIRFVLDHYPISSVNEVRPPWLMSFLPQGAGFFVFQRAELGRRGISLLALENRLIRKRFAEPRIHFALNCASQSCPGLPARPFSGDGLEAELTRETRRFLEPSRNLRIDLEARVVELSAIFDWYESDFTDWVAEHRPDLPETLYGYVASQVQGVKADRLRRCTDCRVVFAEYDWSLNDAR